MDALRHLKTWILEISFRFSLILFTVENCIFCWTIIIKYHIHTTFYIVKTPTWKWCTACLFFIDICFPWHIPNKNIEHSWCYVPLPLDKNYFHMDLSQNIHFNLQHIVLLSQLKNLILISKCCRLVSMCTSPVNFSHIPDDSVGHDVCLIEAYPLLCWIELMYDSHVDF